MGRKKRKTEEKFCSFFYPLIHNLPSFKGTVCFLFSVFFYNFYVLNPRCPSCFPYYPSTINNLAVFATHSIALNKICVHRRAIVRFENKILSDLLCDVLNLSSISSQDILYLCNCFVLQPRTRHNLSGTHATDCANCDGANELEFKLITNL